MNLIVSVNLPSGWGIGRQGRLLYAISADLKRFASLTTGNVVICGRKTLQTFPGGRPLKNRDNWILSASPGFCPEGAVVFPTLDSLLARCAEEPSDRLWVIGGASVYRALLPYCSRACITRTFTPAQADTFFPRLDLLDSWQLVQESDVLTENGVQYQYADYVQAVPQPLPEQKGL